MAKKKSQRTAARRSDSGSTKSGDKKPKKPFVDASKKTKNNNSSKSKNAKANANAHIDWITSLVKDNTSNNDAGAKIPSKEDRKRKRETKKNRRMEQQRQKQLQQLQRQQQRQGETKMRGHDNTVTQSVKPARNTRTDGASSSSERSVVLLKLSKPRLRRLSQIVQISRQQSYDEKKLAKEGPTPYYDLPKTSNAKAPRTSYGHKSESKKRKRGKWNKDSIQPLRSDYSGIGLARGSMYIEFIDPSYYPKLEEEFREHIPGFFGKQRTKAMKKQTDGNMLWRRLANEKKNNKTKKFRGLSADERVRAMIDSTDRADLLG